MNRILQRKNTEPFLAVLLLVLVSAIAYLPLASRFGYYFDDWSLVWAGQTQGPAKLIQMYSIDRPFIGPVFAGLYAVLGENPLPWALTGYLLRVGGGLALLGALRMVWPGQTLATTSMALLFLVYPGFLRQPNTIQYQNHLISIGAELLSIALSLWALRIQRRAGRLAVIALAMILSLIAVLMMEYMFGLEALRGALIWLSLPGRERLSLGSRIRRTLARWSPYLLTLAGFLVWRLFIFKSTRSATDVGALGQMYLSSPGYQLVRVLAEWLKDFWEITLAGWVVPAYRFISEARLRVLLFSLGFALAAAGLCLIYRAWVRRTGSAEERKALDQPGDWSTTAIWVGAVTVLGASLPIILSNRGVEFSTSFDRYTLPGSAGAAILAVGLAGRAVNSRLKDWIPLGLVALAVITHYNNSVYFADYWQAQREFWWQVSWRVPAFTDGALLLANLPDPYPIEEDYEVWGPANLIYHPQSPNPRVYAEVLNMTTAKSVMLGSGSDRIMRTIEFERDFEKTLILSMPTGSSCARAVDGKNLEMPDSEDPTFYLVYPYSRIDMIDPAGTHADPSLTIFGKEPEHGWCYYYEKMSLARQQGAWPEVARLADEAQQLGLRPRDRSEWMPALEAYIAENRADDAGHLASILKEVPANWRQVCETARGPKSPANSFLNDSKSRNLLSEVLCG